MRKINRRVVTEDIYKLVKKQILHQQLKPGEKINIDQYARELDVSNIPIRESLSRLIAEGFVTAIPYKGMFVTHMSIRELDEIFEIRHSLELLALKKAFPSLDKTLIQHVMAKWEERAATFSKEQSNEQVLKTIAQMNDEFHGLYLTHCGNDTLNQVIKLYIERIQRYLSVLLPEMHHDILRLEWLEHEQVIKALAEENQDKAIKMLEQHLSASHIRTKELFLQSNIVTNTQP